ncbi:extensin family protein [Sphingorhabdus sp. Alg239-R122]|uniref:extensin-like domain-containing protein n=1 Tax=Sphingorhabdus sp. Alg239-R122 TaxID=2305989 RepID=UPI0013D8E238|nr:extensin family protein [Sphingorhabdus sp. Alg239-R122]
MVSRYARRKSRKRTKKLLQWLLLAAVITAGWYYTEQNPEYAPWKPLDLADPVGLFTVNKLGALQRNTPECQALLDDAGIEYTALPPRGQQQCRASNLVRPGRGGKLDIGYRPTDVTPSCPVFAGLALWEWHVVKPEAQRLLGSTVVRIRHYGAYSCRRVYGRSEGRWSQHATGNAMDIAGFDLADGRTVNVKRDWGQGTAKSVFLASIRDGACDLFGTVLSPDYNAAHADHFHFDQTDRGLLGKSVCR